MLKRKLRTFKTRASRNLRKTKFYKTVLPKNASQRKKLITLATMGATFALSALLIGVFLITVALAIFSRDLPNPNRLLERSEELSTKNTDRNDQPIYEVYGDKHRVLVKLEDVTPSVLHATLAVEDSNFYSHQGVSIKGLLRAVKNMAFGGSLQSGSTLTQQVVKNALLTQDQTITRKLKELVLSLQLENRYSKDEILQMYINETPYGGQNYGVYTAAKAYFNKAPNELSIAESAFIAGLPQSPSRYSPYSSDPSLGLERKNYVLYLMNIRGWLDASGQRHYLNEEDYKAALDEELKFEAAGVSFKAPHFVFYVREFLAEMYGDDVIEQMGLQVKTTLDLEFQQSVQDIVKEEVDASKYANVNNGALIAVEPKTSQIIAMVGSKDYFAKSEPEGCTSGITGEGSCLFEPNLNVTLAKRQPGSSIKPITYATLLEQGYPASSPLLDVPTNFQGADNGNNYAPVNYDGEYRGPMSLRKSLANSLNVPAVKAIQITGLQAMIKQAQKMGISTFDDPTRYGPSLTLGGGETKLLEMTNAFGVFANGGIYREPTPILEIKDSRGKTLYSYRDNGGKRALSEEVAFLISDILSDDGARSEVFGFGSLLNISGQDVAVKTGTTDDKRDNYAIGYTKDIVIGTWVGNNNNDKMGAVASGISGATPIWRKAMLKFLENEDLEPNDFEAPDSVQKYEVDALTGGKPFKDYNTRYEWFMKGTEPLTVSDWYKILEVCKEDGKLANDACKDADDTETKTYIDIHAAKPEWQMDVDAWISENYSGEEKYFPPKMKSQLKYDGDDVKKDNDPAIEITNFENGDSAPLSFRLKIEVSSARDIDEVRIYMDGNRVSEDKSAPYGYNFNLNASQAGEHEFKVIAEDEKGREGEDKVKIYIVAP